MSSLDAQLITCPYCSETIEILLEPLMDDEIHDYIEDCQVCCRPIHLIVSNQLGHVSVLAKHEDEI